MGCTYPPLPVWGVVGWLHLDPPLPLLTLTCPLSSSPFYRPVLRVLEVLERGGFWVHWRQPFLQRLCLLCHPLPLALLALPHLPELPLLGVM